MLRLLRHVAVDVHRLDELVHRLVLQDRCSYMVNLVLVQPLYVEENQRLLVDEILVDAQQILVELNLDAVHSFLDEAHLLGVVVGEVQRHQLKMDCYLDVVGEVQRHQLKMDYYLDVLQALALQQLVHLLGRE